MSNMRYNTNRETLITQQIILYELCKQGLRGAKHYQDNAGQQSVASENEGAASKGGKELQSYQAKSLLRK